MKCSADWRTCSRLGRTSPARFLTRRPIDWEQFAENSPQTTPISPGGKRKGSPKELNKMRLLVVEDEEKVMRFVTLGLKAEQFAVDETRDGRTGLAMALETPYDLLIVDLMLPELSGTELISRLRRHNTTVPVIVLTARDAVDDKVRNFESGADDYITKPFAFAELLVRIKSLLRRGSVSRSNVISVGDLEMDRVAHQVRRQGKAIRLTAKEYGLLEYLAMNAGRVLSRTMI